MKLVSSNDGDFLQQTIQEALAVYRDKSDPSAALDVLTKLKGIGPATASLLLAVHDPTRVMFFADEAFHWLCSGGEKAPIKYNAKEYKTLNDKAQTLIKRLGTRATDVERVAFVIMRDVSSVPSTANKTANKTADKRGAKSAPVKNPAEQSVKRKATSENDAETKSPIRRSKRGKHV
jgi:hypothetical protein